MPAFGGLDSILDISTVASVSLKDKGSERNYHASRYEKQMHVISVVLAEELRIFAFAFYEALRFEYEYSSLYHIYKCEYE